MEKQQQKITFKDKIKMLFCGKPASIRQNSPIVYKKQPERRQNPIRKQPRQTLNIDDVFLKLTRKNIVQEQFFSNQVMNLQLQKHIANRIKGCTVGLVKGQFTQQSTQTLKIPIYLNEKPVKTIPYRQQIKTDSTIKIRQNFIDVVLYQTSQTCSNPLKKPKLKNPSQIQAQSQININININNQKQIEQQFNQILSMLNNYNNRSENIVIVCSKFIDLLDFSKQLMGFTRDYLFQLERIRENQQLVCNIMYLAKSASFIKLNDKVFKQYMMGEMDMTLQQQARMGDIMGRLVSEKYHREITNVVRSLKKQIFTTRSLFEPFIVRISQNQQMRKVITQMKSLVFKQQSLENTPQLLQPTPLFNYKTNSTYQESHR